MSQWGHWNIGLWLHVTMLWRKKNRTWPSCCSENRNYLSNGVTDTFYNTALYLETNMDLVLYLILMSPADNRVNQGSVPVFNIFGFLRPLVTSGVGNLKVIQRKGLGRFRRKECFVGRWSHILLVSTCRTLGQLHFLYPTTIYQCSPHRGCKHNRRTTPPTSLRSFTTLILEASGTFCDRRAGLAAR